MHWRVHRRSDHERRKNEKRGDVRREETRKLLLFDERGRNEDRRAGDGQPHEVHQPQLRRQLQGEDAEDEHERRQKRAEKLHHDQEEDPGRRGADAELRRQAVRQAIFRKIQSGVRLQHFKVLH